MVENSKFSTLLAYAILSLGVIIIAFPLYYAFVASSAESAMIANGQLPLWPQGHLLENYGKLFSSGMESASVPPLMVPITNSLMMAIGIAVGKIAVSLISAFAIVFFRFPFRQTLFWIIFITLMLPVEVRIFPTVEVVTNFHLLNTYQGLILPLMASATATLLFRQFFSTIPDEMVEAAKIDGAGPMRFFKDMVLPLSTTSIAAMFVIQFIYGWNQYLWPMLITTKDSMATIVIIIRKTVASTDAVTDWPLVMAIAILALLPPVIVVITMQRFFIRGLTETEK